MLENRCESCTGGGVGAASRLQHKKTKNMITYKSYLCVVDFKPDSGIPIYMQMVFSIINDIRIGKLEVGDWMPSIYDYAILNGISKNTVARAYIVLKQKGIIHLNQNKRYVVMNEHAAKLLRDTNNAIDYETKN